MALGHAQEAVASLARQTDDHAAAVARSVTESHSTCLVGAILAGALVTLSAVVLTLKFSRIPRRLATALEATSLEASAARRGAKLASDTELKLLKGLKPVKGGPYQVNVEKLTRWMTQNRDAPARMLLDAGVADSEKSVTLIVRVAGWLVAPTLSVTVNEATYVPGVE